MIKKICEQCGKEFEVYPSRQSAKFCSQNCYHRYNRDENNFNWKGGKIKTKCGYCGKELIRWPFEIRQRKSSFCNSKCQMLYYYKNNIIINNTKYFKKGFHHPAEFKKGESRIPWNKGIESTPEMKIHLRKLQTQNWKNNEYLFNTFKGQMFGKEHEPNELDKEIIRTRMRLFKIHHKEVTHETGRL